MKALIGPPPNPHLWWGLLICLFFCVAFDDRLAETQRQATDVKGKNANHVRRCKMHSVEYDRLVNAEDYRGDLHRALHELVDWNGANVIEAGITGRVTELYARKRLNGLNALIVNCICSSCKA